MRQKTKQAAFKRFSVSARGKVRHRRVHQSHFNAKDAGEQTRRKHAPVPLAAADRARIVKLLPYL